MKCAHCEIPLVRRPKWSQQIGWARERGAGGLNALSDRKSTGKVLCDECGDHLYHTGRHRNLIPKEQMRIG